MLARLQAPGVTGFPGIDPASPQHSRTHTGNPTSISRSFLWRNFGIICATREVYAFKILIWRACTGIWIYIWNNERCAETETWVIVCSQMNVDWKRDRIDDGNFWSSSDFSAFCFTLIIHAFWGEKESFMFLFCFQIIEAIHFKLINHPFIIKFIHFNGW